MPGYRISKPWESTEESRQSTAGYNQPDPSASALGVLAGLQDKPMFQGADPAKVEERRRRNKQAKKSRRANRRGA